jgi:hypothetical protein
VCVWISSTVFQIDNLFLLFCYFCCCCIFLSLTFTFEYNKFSSISEHFIQIIQKWTRTNNNLKIHETPAAHNTSKLPLSYRFHNTWLYPIRYLSAILKSDRMHTNVCRFSTPFIVLNFMQDNINILHAI